MARPRSIDPEWVSKAQDAVAQACDLQELKAAQAVLLPALLGATLADTAMVLGVGRATVARLQARFRQAKPRRSARKSRAWGGRRNALLSLEEEEAFLRPWLEQAEKGGVLVVSPLRQALAERLGQPVKPSVVYRLLARHGWRKVAPDTSHPKSDPAAQADWKKTSANSGGPAETRGSEESTGAADVPGRGALRADGAHPPLLRQRHCGRSWPTVMSASSFMSTAGSARARVKWIG